MRRWKLARATIDATARATVFRRSNRHHRRVRTPALAPEEASARSDTEPLRSPAPPQPHGSTPPPVAPPEPGGAAPPPAVGITRSAGRLVAMTVVGTLIVAGGSFAAGSLLFGSKPGRVAAADPTPSATAAHPSPSPSHSHGGGLVQSPPLCAGNGKGLYTARLPRRGWFNLRDPDGGIELESRRGSYLFIRCYAVHTHMITPGLLAANLSRQMAATGHKVRLQRSSTIQIDGRRAPLVVYRDRYKHMRMWGEQTAVNTPKASNFLITLSAPSKQAFAADRRDVTRMLRSWRWLSGGTL